MERLRLGTWWIAVALALCSCSSAESDSRGAERAPYPPENGAPRPANPGGPSAAAGASGVSVPGTPGTPGVPGTPGMGAAPTPTPGAPPSDAAEQAPPSAGDDYRAPGTNPFVYAAHDPLSTFAVDVDTASYDVFRRDVNLGTLPNPASVRLEEYVNNFAYDYPAPNEDNEHPFSISLAAAPSLFPRETTVLRVGIQGRLPPAEEKKPANLVFLVDTSGSMASSDRLPLAQQVLTETLQILDPNDTVSIVSYAGSTAVRLEPTPVSSRARIEQAIAGLQSAGGTAGGAGLTLAYQQAERGFLEGGINHVVLCTDGDFNIGPSSTSELLTMIREKRQTGVTFTALGFGVGNLNDDMLETISNAGNGVYGVISNPDQASEYVHRRMLSTIVHIAKDMKIQVEFNPERVLAYRLLGYENRALADDQFRDDLVDAGEIGAGHRVTALYEVVPAGGEIPSATGMEPMDGAAFDGDVEVSADELVLVKVRYKQPGAAETDPAAEVSQALSPDEVAEDASALDLDFQWALGIASFAEILKKSPFADPESLGLIEEIVRRPGHLEKGDRQEFVTLFDKVLEFGIDDSR